MPIVWPAVLLEEWSPLLIVSAGVLNESSMQEMSARNEVLGGPLDMSMIE